MGRCVEGRGDVEDSMGETGERVGDTDRETHTHRDTERRPTQGGVQGVWRGEAGVSGERGKK